MRYRSEDRLRDLEFHDSVWTLASRDEDCAALDVKYLNIHADAPENPGECDMEIEAARLTLTGFGVLSFAPADGAAGPREGGRMPVYTGEKAEAMFLDEMRRGATCCRFQMDGDAWTLDGCGEAPFFTAKLAFRQAVLEWDAYRRPAWYVLLARGIRA